MPKMKTHKASAKRFRVTGSGKIMRAKANKGHFRVNKSPGAVRDMDKQFEVAKSDRKAIARNLGKR